MFSFFFIFSFHQKFTEKYKPQVITALKYSPTLESAVKNSKGKTNLPPTLVKKIQTEDRDMYALINSLLIQ